MHHTEGRRWFRLSSPRCLAGADVWPRHIRALGLFTKQSVQVEAPGPSSWPVTPPLIASSPLNRVACSTLVNHTRSSVDAGLSKACKVCKVASCASREWNKTNPPTVNRYKGYRQTFLWIYECCSVYECTMSWVLHSTLKASKNNLRHTEELLWVNDKRKGTE